MTVTTELRAPSAGEADRLFLEALASSFNEILSDLIQATLRALLQNAQKDHLSPDMKISQLEQVLDGLRRRRDLHLEQMDRMHRGIVSHRQLPPEILARIFVESFDPAEVIVPPPRKSSIPWALGQVCSRWRDILRAEPLLWTRIVVANTRGLSHIHTLSLIGDILGRCGGRGKVELCVSPSSDEEWKSLQHLVSIHSTRVLKLDLVLNDTCFAALIQPLEVFNNLESLSLSFAHIRSPSAPNAISFYAFSAAQDLRNVTIQFSLYPDATDHSGRVLRWAHLTDLSLLGVSATSALVILTHCSLLANLKLDVRRKGHNIKPSFNTVSLTHLRSISITTKSIRDLKNLFSLLILPALTKLMFRECHLEDGWLDQSGLALLFERSSCNITSFQTCGFIFPSKQLISIMRAMPSLTEFLVTTGEISADILSTIVEEGLVPNLYLTTGNFLPYTRRQIS